MFAVDVWSCCLITFLALAFPCAGDTTKFPVRLCPVSARTKNPQKMVRMFLSRSQMQGIGLLDDEGHAVKGGVTVTM